MHVLVLNAGSSSLKYKLFDMRGPSALAAGQVERVGQQDAVITHRWDLHTATPQSRRLTLAVANQQVALDYLVAHLEQTGLVSVDAPLAAVGHRVVHGGEHFNQPVLIDEQAVTAIRAVTPLAPLHNPANLEGIEVARQRWPELPQVAVFDTAFHQSMPEHAYRYAIPQQHYQAHGVRRYGFHGSSHRYVSRVAAEWLGKSLQQTNLITLHLGNGCSAAAIEQGRSVDTSMGMTPLEGLVMGTRCGSIDPSISFFLQRQAGFSGAEVENQLNKQSGLLGICGLSDMREIANTDTPQARLAEQMFAYAVKKYIGAYLAVLGSVDALVFTGGIGEHASNIRALSCSGLEGLGLVLDVQLNAAPADGLRAISTTGSAIPVLVIPTDEELEIASSVARLVKA